MLRAATSILEHGRSLEADSLCMPIKEILELIPEGPVGGV
jgi:phosphoenolpyruvate phosphomutase